jgi:hypothetical protein
MVAGAYAMKGYVYVLSNKSMPGLVKIGRTTVSPSQRMQELHSTGVPTPFELEFAVEVADCQACESAAHRVLDAHRVSHKREFFKVTVRSTIVAILAKLEHYTISHVKEPHEIEQIEVYLRERREEQQATIRAQQDRRVMEERERAREKGRRVVELQGQLDSAMARRNAMGARPAKPHTGPVTDLLFLCWTPIPWGWLVWLGSLSAFSGPYKVIGYACIALLINGFFASRRLKDNDAAHSQADNPFSRVEEEIGGIKTAIKELGASSVLTSSPPMQEGSPQNRREPAVKYVVIPCPRCEGQMRLPADKTLEVKCPHCHEAFRTKT